MSTVVSKLIHRLRVIHPHQKGRPEIPSGTTPAAIPLRFLPFDQLSQVGVMDDEPPVVTYRVKQGVLSVPTLKNAGTGLAVNRNDINIIRVEVEGRHSFFVQGEYG